jgi:PIN like domain
VQPLRAMLGLAKKNSEEEVDFANGEIASFVDAHLLPGPLKKVLKNIEIEERVRNRGTIPPSFNDAHKRTTREEGDNSFGDLAFWKEILRHAAGVSARTLIIATGDRKNDWFVNYHGNDSVSPDLRKKVQNPRPVPLPHPLLVREAYDRGAGELALIDPVYCAAIMERKGQQYKAFASAAMDTALPKLVTKNVEGQVWAARVGQAARLVATPIPSESGAGAADGNDAETSEAAPAALDAELLKARPDDCSPKAREFFEKLDVAADVAARAELYGEIEWESLEDWSPTDLVVLGGKLTRAAEAGDPSALRLVSDLRDQAPSISGEIANAVYLGGLGAIYFDEGFARRVPSGSAVAQILLDLVCIPALRRASAVVGAVLSEAFPQPAFLPGSDVSSIDLEFIVRASADNKSPADLVAINLQGRNLTTDLQTEEGLRFTSIFQRSAEARDFTVAGLCDVVARFHLLPRQLVKPNLEVTSVVRVAEYAGVDIET